MTETVESVSLDTGIYPDRCELVVNGRTIASAFRYPEEQGRKALARVNTLYSIAVTALYENGPLSDVLRAADQP